MKPNPCQLCGDSSERLVRRVCPCCWLKALQAQQMLAETGVKNISIAKSVTMAQTSTGQWLPVKNQHKRKIARDIRRARRNVTKAMKATRCFPSPLPKP